MIKFFFGFWHTISTLGIRAEMPYALSRRIILSNQLALILGLASALTMAFYVVRSIGFRVESVSIGIIIGIIVPFFNYLRRNILTRFFISISIAAISLSMTLLNKIAHPEATEIIQYVTPKFQILCSVIIPVCIFTLRERWIMLAAILVILTVGLGMESIHSYYGVHYEQLGIESRLYEIVHVDAVIMLIILFSSLFFLLSINQSYEKQSQQLLQEAQMQNQTSIQREQALQQALAEMNESRKKEKIRGWASHGIAESTRILQQTQQDAQWIQSLMSFIVNYVKASQGAIYLTDKDGQNEPFLLLKGYYAQEAEKYLKARFEWGEGILGQCAADNQLIHLKEIPPQFSKISTGLGQAHLEALLLIPLLFNGHTVGVLELGFLEEVADYKIDFLRTLSENIAVTIATLQSNQQTTELLTRSQMMFKELEFTQKMMMRKEKEYLNKIQKLEESTLTPKGGDD